MKKEFPFLILIFTLILGAQVFFEVSPLYFDFHQTKGLKKSKEVQTRSANNGNLNSLQNKIASQTQESAKQEDAAMNLANAHSPLQTQTNSNISTQVLALEPMLQSFQQGLMSFSVEHYRESEKQNGNSYSFVTQAVDLLEDVWKEFIEKNHHPEVALQFYIQCAVDRDQKIPQFLQAYCWNKAEQVVSLEGRLQKLLQQQKNQVKEDIRLASQRLND